MLKLPNEITQGIEDILAEYDTLVWRERAIRLSKKYMNQRKGSADSYIADPLDVAAYFALRAPATFAQIYGALSQTCQLFPTWQPKTMLDLGAGTGSGLWAARQVFASIDDYTAVERDAHCARYGRELAKVIEHTHRWIEKDLARTAALPQESQESYDLVILSSVLNECTPETLRTILAYAWKRCAGVLLIIEPHATYGYATIADAQQYTKSISEEENLVAPYIDGQFVADESIYFSQRITRPEFLRMIRQEQRKQSATTGGSVLAASDWEECGFYYLAYSRQQPEILPQGRIASPTVVHKGYLERSILTHEGVVQNSVQKRDKEAFRLAKKQRWGDLIFQTGFT